jgi:hypothetical protein
MGRFLLSIEVCSCYHANYRFLSLVAFGLYEMFASLKRISHSYRSFQETPLGIRYSHGSLRSKCLLLLYDYMADYGICIVYLRSNERRMALLCDWDWSEYGHDSLWDTVEEDWTSEVSAHSVSHINGRVSGRCVSISVFYFLFFD